MIQICVQPQYKTVCLVAQQAKPFVISNYAVKQITVGYQKSLPMNRVMFKGIAQINVAKSVYVWNPCSKVLIMITQNISHLCASLGRSENSSNHIAMCLWPEFAAFQFPQIKYVTNEV